MVGGLFVASRRVWHAWLRGRHSRNLYRAPYDDALLSRTVGDVRRELGLEEPLWPARASDVFWFVLASLAGLAIGLVLFALLIPIAIIANVAAFFRRR